jgi:hypothetical protein
MQQVTVQRRPFKVHDRTIFFWTPKCTPAKPCIWRFAIT